MTGRDQPIGDCPVISRRLKSIFILKLKHFFFLNALLHNVSNVMELFSSDFDGLPFFEYLSPLNMAVILMGRK